MIDIRKSTDRGVAEHGWLSSRHTFSFGHYHDPGQVGFSDLLVINEDRVVGGRGFGQHAHSDMEIFSYVLEGALEHKDTMGTSAVIRRGDVQLLSAGTGVAHSEFNHSTTEQVHFLQFWIAPDQRGVAPRYQQIHFPDESKRGRLLLIISPNGQDGSLAVYQDVRVYAGLFDTGQCDALSIAPGRCAYVHVARGSITLNGVALGEGDGARVQDVPRLEFKHGQGAEVLVFNLPPHVE